MLSWIKQKSRQRKTAILFVVGFVLFGFSVLLFDLNTASAQDAFGIETVEESGIVLPSTDIRIVIGKIIRAVLGFLGIIAVTIILYAGFTIMTSRGEQDKVLKGRKILINAVIGLVIIIASLGIVQFIISSLTDAIFGGRGTAVSAPAFNSFAGSGSMGRIIKDHYPFRDQTGIPRNTRIAVTFAEAINPESLINDNSGNGVFGDCYSDFEGTIKSDFCDRLKGYPDEPVVRIYFSPTEKEQEIIYIDAEVRAVRDVNGDVYTFVFLPVQPLGSDVEDIWHTVYLTSDIEKANGDGVFESQRSDYYKWEFQTNTLFDFTPPTVKATYPRDGKTAPRNTVVQIHFDEAVDPSTLDGAASNNTTLVFYTKKIEGEWQLTNGYKTTEFISNDACGQNSCGETIYCLPANGIDGNEAESRVLARTAELQHGKYNTEPDKFASEFGAGVSDMAGNALDGNKDREVDGRPPLPEDKNTIGTLEIAPDNFNWTFVIEDRIDRTSPFIIETSPAADAQGVRGRAPLTATFSKPMMHRSFNDNNNVSLEEHPTDEAVGPDGEIMDSIWFSILSDLLSGDTTLMTWAHREFGPNDLDLYYFPNVNSSVKDVSQNCLYPGRGPELPTGNEQIQCQVTYNDLGFVSQVVGCIPGETFDPDTDTACVAGISTKLHKDISTCLDMMRDESLTNL